jgi:F0F1-type ATP synthase assembly protein I
VNQTDERRELYRGASAGFQRGLEIALAPVVLGLLGWLLDQWLGLTPLLTIVFAIFAVAGTGAKIYYQYTAEMDAHEADAVWNRR